MDNLTKQFAQLADMQPPEDLHDKIMSAVLVESAKKPFTITMGLIFLTLLTSGGLLIAELIESDIPALGITLVRNFDLRLATVTDYGAIVLQQLPSGLVAVFTLTVVLGVYFIQFMQRRYQALGSWLHHDEIHV
ncbi:hypothetical protein HY065_00520 [Candidatus Berkelbacteria bacterium]|nr:hypothetical protein [Candidatus Berkelbacteria bacterium]